LFADLVGFTSFSARLAPSELVRRLNTLFTEFDRLTERYAVEKIKTIGDAYMVAAGVPEPIENGAEALTDLALDMLDACQRLGDGLEIRVGVHSGPAVAGVIGTRKFSYDLWGDTVNTAARMELHGVPGKIQISDDTRRRLGPRFLVEPRGEIDVKGRGRMVTWFVTGRGNVTENHGSLAEADRRGPTVVTGETGVSSCGSRSDCPA
jgi:class 3 adenylate cyclase